MMHYFTAQDIVILDTAVAEKEEREHLVKAYVGFRSAGLDGYAYILTWNQHNRHSYNKCYKINIPRTPSFFISVQVPVSVRLEAYYLQEVVKVHCLVLL